VRPKSVPAKHDENYPSEVMFNAYPLASILLMCDQIEIWDRQTGQESRFNKIPLDSVELYSLIRDNNRLEGVINYVPFKSIAPKAVEMEKITRDLQERLNMKTIPTLEAIKLTLDNRAVIQIKFMIDGRYQIGNWNSS
jgi:hypothetical protein